MNKYILFIFIQFFIGFFANSFEVLKNSELNNQMAEKSKIRVDLLPGAGYAMWICGANGADCSSTFIIGNGAEIEVVKGDIFHVSIAALPRICDFYKVNQSNSFAVLTYWGTVFNPYSNVYGNDTVEFIKRETTYNLSTGCAGLQGKINEKK
ncbi:hypothetical protein [Silvanigrella aquatica]|uniref:Uncharacterized protein n=1 Tax=Silvanigrella aquatica TaxID=1915309 RepID=A0A1L4CYB4_9BACT|nr:hypothetical protein [Silvanigrella aquatica]APJ02953.1 hypothetical protein AXG55_03095 [Silvanigrella aquatica]